MTTEKQATNTAPSDNKVIFGPLGKYAVIAIIMVSIIVTTAIMLEKQLNTIDQQVADLEAEIAESNKKKLISSKATASTDISDTAISAEAASQTSAAVETSLAEAPVVTKAKNIASAEETNKNSTLAVETVDDTKNISAEPTLATSTSVEQTAQVTPVATIKQILVDRQVKLTDRLTNRNKAREEVRQARTQAFKLEQKKHMSELFARIKALESRQLDRYKVSQQNQVVSLRKQVTRQQQMIEALALRNKDLYELRSATAQRNQSNREQMLNRI
ncbi:hypothetical protein MNBD_GAMMA05-1331 [hydrothermal vent metagenome]|uniref:Uncharacterized protein n=1 Tax=hydrothermal vent metagenome TaxID=652676 RepID=A0A3B0WD06_9ZZZZ